MYTPHLDAHMTRVEVAEVNDTARYESDLDRFAAGERGTPVLAAVMQTFKTTVPVLALHHEVPIAIREVSSSEMFWIFHRRYGADSEHGMRIVHLVMVPGSRVWEPIDDTFVSKPKF